MLQRPKILVVSRQYTRKDKLIQFVGEYHLDAIVASGGIPVIVPAIGGISDSIETYTAMMDGLLIIEGGDIHPKRYDPGVIDISDSHDIEEIKDDIEFKLVAYAIKHDLPYLGICRGLQIMNVLYGGTLYQDVQKDKGTDLKHIDYDNYDSYRHSVRLIEGSPLQKIYNKSELKVTSYHHQGIKALGKGLLPLVYSPDELIEGAYDPEKRFMYGLQFHPERQMQEYEGNKVLYQQFVGACQV